MYCNSTLSIGWAAGLGDLNYTLKGRKKMSLVLDDIKKAVIRSQHCQRNFDLAQTMPQEDVDLLVYSAANCPSKQNISFYNLHVITDYETISRIHDVSAGATAVSKDTGERQIVTNSQVLANVLFVFERKTRAQMSDRLDNNDEKHDHDLDSMFDLDEAQDLKLFERDQDTAIGIAAGYLNIVASMMGYSTGCCQCFDSDAIEEILGLEGKPALLMGIGFKDATRNRREHPLDSNLVFSIKKKEDIDVRVIA